MVLSNGMKNKSILIVVGVVLVVALGFFLIRSKKNTTAPSATEEVTLDLPINVLPLAERPFITLAPDSTGRSLNLTVVGAPKEGEMEYELVYQSVEKQEGVFGRLNLVTESQPILKSLLLGSKSGGGKVTYHEGVTGGSITVTYNETKLKESWNFLSFDPTDPTFSSTDAKFHVTLSAKSLKKGDKVVTMKTFGYPKTVLPDAAKIVSGPYAYYPATTIKGNVTVELKLPAGEHVNPTLYEFDGKTWKKLATKVVSDTVSSVVATGNIFLVTAE